MSMTRRNERWEEDNVSEKKVDEKNGLHHHLHPQQNRLWTDHLPLRESPPPLRTLCLRQCPPVGAEQ